MRLFNINKSTGEVIVENDYILGIPEFKAVINNKMYNSATLLYIFFMSDWTGNNYLAGYDDSTLNKYAIKESGVNPNSISSKEVTSAINKYIEIQRKLSPSIAALITAKKSLRQAGVFLTNITSQNELLQINVEKLTLLVSETNDTAEASKIISQINTFNNAIKSNINDLLSMVNSIAKAVTDIDKLEQKVKEEYKEQVERVGSKKYGSREKPGYNIIPKDI
jgi:hypothetical protein